MILTESGRKSVKATRLNLENRPGIPLVTRRPDLEFKNDTIPRFYYRDSPGLTNIFNAFNVQSVPIETYFLRDGRATLLDERIQDAELRQEIEKYLRQEATHVVAHNKLNALLRERGYPVDWAQELMMNRLAKLDGDHNLMLRVATGVASEHILGEIGEIALNHAAFTDGLDPSVKALILWHFYEEIEHKAVAFDAYNAAFGKNWRSYFTRVRGLCTLFGILIPTGIRIRAAFRKVDGIRMRRKDWMEVLRFVLVEPAFLPRIARAVLAFLNPRFDPWVYRDDSPNLERYCRTAVRPEWALTPASRGASNPDPD
jgi:uncharacterized protein